MATHLDALNLRLSNERIRLANAKTQSERDLRSRWIAQTEGEIAREKTGSYFDNIENEISDEELLRELSDIGG